MGVASIHIDLSKAGNLTGRFGRADAQQPPSIWALVFRLAIERQFSTWAETHSYTSFIDARKASSDRVRKFRSDQFISNLCRPRFDLIQTVVTHYGSPSRRPGAGRRIELAQIDNHASIAAGGSAQSLMLGAAFCKRRKRRGVARDGALPARGLSATKQPT